MDQCEQSAGRQTITWKRHINTVILPIWKPSGDFALRAVGTSHCRDAFSELMLAGPNIGELCFLTVVLFPYQTNPEDPEAVAVMRLDEPKQLGHLPRDKARIYRSRLAELGLSGPSACSAVISGGWKDGERMYDHSLELDIDLDTNPASDEELSYPQPLHQLRWKRVSTDEDATQEYRCWLSAPVDELHVSWKVDAWVKPEWATVNYFAKRVQGIGYGQKLLEIDKQEHDRLFGGREVDVELFCVEGRWGTVYLDQVLQESPSPRFSRTGGRPLRRFLLLREQLSMLYRKVQSVKDPNEKLALALEGQTMQYSLAELGGQRLDYKQTFAEAALISGELISQAYIGITVRGLSAQGRLAEARQHLDCFTKRMPRFRESSVAKALERLESQAC